MMVNVVSMDHPLSFEKADRELCFNRIDRRLRMPDENMHFPKVTRAVHLQLGRCALRGDAGRAGRYQALGLQ